MRERGEGETDRAKRPPNTKRKKQRQGVRQMDKLGIAEGISIESHFKVQ